MSVCPNQCLKWVAVYSNQFSNCLLQDIILEIVIKAD